MQSKSKRSRSVFSAAPLAALALALAGCPGPRTVVTTNSDKPHDGRTVRVACPGDPSAAVVGRYSRAWAARAGAAVKVVPCDGEAGRPDADVWVIAPAELPRRAARGELRPVPEEVRGRPS